MQVPTFLFAFLLTAALTCNKSESVLHDHELVTLSYTQTQCADPWQTSTNDNTTVQNVKTYLQNAGVTPTSVNIKQTVNYEGVCLACTCPTGKTIYVTIPDDENIKAKLRELKFQ